MKNLKIIKSLFFVVFLLVPALLFAQNDLQETIVLRLKTPYGNVELGAFTIKYKENIVSYTITKLDPFEDTSITQKATQVVLEKYDFQEYDNENYSIVYNISQNGLASIQLHIEVQDKEEGKYLKRDFIVDLKNKKIYKAMNLNNMIFSKKLYLSFE